MCSYLYCIRDRWDVLIGNLLESSSIDGMHAAVAQSSHCDPSV